MDNKKIYYTYHIVDPETDKVFYVGKGHGRRMTIHMIRALKWKETGKIISGGNKYLYSKLLKIYSKGFDPIYRIVFESEIEKDVLKKEEQDIKSFGLDNLCNLTYGGEGETRSPESLEKLSKSLQLFWHSEDGYALKKKFSEERLGENNPMWGRIEDEHHKKERMKNCLSQDRWNKGLKGDIRCGGFVKGNVPHNSLRCRLLNKDGRIFEANSITELSKLSGVPLISISRLHLGIYKKNKAGWTFELIERKNL